MRHTTPDTQAHHAFSRFTPPLRRALALLRSPLAGAPRRLAGARVEAAPVGGAARAWAAVRAVRPVGALP